jgi:hypothetical protein
LHFKEAPVTRTSWFDDKAEQPVVLEGVKKLESFTAALADGVIEKNELATQEQRLVAAMKLLEKELNDEQHARATEVLVELTAYNVMRLLHDLQVERVRIAFG